MQAQDTTAPVALSNDIPGEIHNVKRGCCSQNFPSDAFHRQNQPVSAAGPVAVNETSADALSGMADWERVSRAMPLRSHESSGTRRQQCSP